MSKCPSKLPIFDVFFILSPIASLWIFLKPLIFLAKMGVKIFLGDKFLHFSPSPLCHYLNFEKSLYTLKNQAVIRVYVPHSQNFIQDLLRLIIFYTSPLLCTLISLSYQGWKWGCFCGMYPIFCNFLYTLPYRKISIFLVALINTVFASGSDG